jgi:ribosomal protein S16
LYSGVGGGIHGLYNKYETYKNNINFAKAAIDSGKLLEDTIKSVAESKLNKRAPGKMEEMITNSLGEESFYIDANVYEQRLGESARQYDERLGITEEMVQRAKDTGEDLEISAAKYLSAAAEDENLKAIQGDLRSDPFDSMSVNEAESFENDKAKNENEINETKKSLEEVQLEIAEHAKQAKEIHEEIKQIALDSGRTDLFGDSGHGAENVANLLTARILTAANALNISPREYYEKKFLKLKINAEQIEGGLAAFEQAAMYKNPASTFAEFRNNTLSGKSGDSYFSFTDKNGTEIRIARSNLIHADKNHNLTDSQWQAVIDGMDNIEVAYFVEGEKGEYDGQPVAAIINTPLGKAGVVLEITGNGRTFLKNAFFSTDKNLNRWLQQKRKERTPRALETDKTATAISTGRPFSVKSIQEALGVVKESGDMLYQDAVEKIPEGEVDIHSAMEHIENKQLENDVEEWGKAIDTYVNNPKGWNKSKPIPVLSKTPPIFELFGAIDLPITMNARHFGNVIDTEEKKAFPKEKRDKLHPLPPEIIKQIPQALMKPVMILKDLSSRGSENKDVTFIVMLELQHEGKSIVVPFTLNKEFARKQYNIIDSVFDKDGRDIKELGKGVPFEEYFLIEAEKNLLYIDREKAQKWAHMANEENKKNRSEAQSASITKINKI